MTSIEGSQLVDAIYGLIKQRGGLPALLQQLETNGLTDVVKSWISKGDNLPISPAQLYTTLGEETVRNTAEQSGLSTGDLLRQLATYLPQIVDRMTPDGRMPAGQGWLETVMNFIGSKHK